MSINVVYIRAASLDYAFVPTRSAPDRVFEAFEQDLRTWLTFEVEWVDDARDPAGDADVVELWGFVDGFMVSPRAAELVRGDHVGGQLLAVSGSEYMVFAPSVIADVVAPGGCTFRRAPTPDNAIGRLARLELVAEAVPVRQFFTFRSRPDYRPIGLFASSDTDGRYPAFVEALLAGSIRGGEVRPVWSDNAGPVEFAWV